MRNPFSGFTGLVGKLGPLLGLPAGLGLVGGAAAGFKKAIDEAANMETMQTSFKVMLGSIDAAKERMADLANFANSTPFELPEVAAASRTLQTLTKGALATGQGLTLVGDVASAVNQPFEDIAVTVGRLYDGLQSGRPVGETIARLQELGIISGETRGKIEALQASGKKGAAVWSLAALELGKFSGMMDEKSKDWQGMMSNLSGAVNKLFVDFGTPVMLSLKPLLSEGIGLADRLADAARSAGEQLAGGITFLRDAFSQGNLGEVLGLSLNVGFSRALDFLTDKLADIITGAGSGMMNAFAGVGDVMAGSITKGIAASLRDLKIMGRSVTDHTQLNELNMSGNRMQDAGFARLGNSGLGGFLSGLTKNTPAAEARLEALSNKMKLLREQNAMLESPGTAIAENAAPTTPAAKLASAGQSINTSPMNVFSDRLAKIGGFIGGSGGVRGEKAAQDTARNTAHIITAIKDLDRTVAGKGSTGGIF